MHDHAEAEERTPDGGPRRRHGLRWLPPVLLVVLMALALLAQRPTVVLGVSEAALHSSLQRTVGGATLINEPCVPAGGGYECLATSGSGGETYGVSVNGAGCWTAVRTSPGGGDEVDFPVRTEGCITAWDVLRPWSRI